MVQSCAAHRKSQVDVHAPVADVAVGVVSGSVEHHQDVEIDNTVPIDVPATPDLVLTGGAQSFASLLEEKCVETVNLTTSNTNMDCAQSKADKNSKIQRWQLYRLGDCAANPPIHVVFLPALCSETGTVGQ